MPSAWTKRGFVNVDETPDPNDLTNVAPAPQEAVRYVTWISGNLFNIDDVRTYDPGVLSVVKVRFVEGRFDE